jgi:two-component system, OmpR family, response regulator
MNNPGVAVVVEDDSDLRNLVEAVLLQSGFTVYKAANGRAGVDLVRRVVPDLVTLDIGLPDLDGLEVLRRIREYSNAYVLMLTGRTGAADQSTAFHSGADAYITKPFRPNELRASIATMMRVPRHQTADSYPPG